MGERKDLEPEFVADAGLETADEGAQGGWRSQVQAGREGRQQGGGEGASTAPCWVGARGGGRVRGAGRGARGVHPATVAVVPVMRRGSPSLALHVRPVVERPRTRGRRGGAGAQSSSRAGRAPTRAAPRARGAPSPRAPRARLPRGRARRPAWPTRRWTRARPSPAHTTSPEPTLCSKRSRASTRNS